MTNTMVFSSLRRRWHLVLAGLLLGALAGWVAQSVMPKQYEASSLLLLSAPRIDAPGEGSEYVTSRMPTYAALATSRPVLDGARRSLGLPGPSSTVARKISADVQPSTLLITLRAEWTDRQGAAKLANAVAQSYAALAPALDSAERPVLSVAIIEDAVPPEHPSGPSVPVMVLMGSILGLTAGMLAALVESAAVALERVQKPLSLDVVNAPTMSPAAGPEPR